MTQLSNVSFVGAQRPGTVHDGHDAEVEQFGEGAVGGELADLDLVAVGGAVDAVLLARSPGARNPCSARNRSARATMPRVLSAAARPSLVAATSGRRA